MKIIYTDDWELGDDNDELKRELCCISLAANTARLCVILMIMKDTGIPDVMIPQYSLPEMNADRKEGKSLLYQIRLYVIKTIIHDYSSFNSRRVTLHCWLCSLVSSECSSHDLSDLVVEHFS